MPSLVVPFSKLELRQFEGIVPEKRFWLAFRVCSWFREAHSGGSEPVRVLLLRLTCFRLELPDQEDGMEPASRHRRASYILQIIKRFELQNTSSFWGLIHTDALMAGWSQAYSYQKP